jgi:hypothetical protein
VTFKRASKYHEVSDSGQYTVCWVSGKYEAWHLQEQLEVNLTTAEEAREICRTHQAKAAQAA